MSYKDSRRYVLHGDEREKLAEDSAYYLSLHDDNSSVLSIDESKEYMIDNPRYNYITEVKDSPWNVTTIRQVIKKVSRLKNRQHLFTDKALWEVSRLLKIIFTRLSKEIKRFAQKFNICTRNEVYSATQVIFSKSVSRSCIGSAYQAYHMYLDSIRKQSDRHLRISKSERAGLTMSVGKMFRWMVRNKIAAHITDSAAVYLTAVIEYLIEEICCMGDKIVNKLKNASLGNYSILVDDILPSLVSKPDIWRACQSFEHLCVTRFNEQSVNQDTPQDKLFYQVRHFVNEETLTDSVTCVGSRDEVESIIGKSSAANNPDTPRHRSVRRSIQSPGKASSLNGSGLAWNNSAIDLIYELTKCSKLQFAEDDDNNDVNGHSSLLTNTHCEDAHPLSEWIKMSGVFAKSRLGKVVDENDVREAARLLLPGHFCHPRKAWPDLINKNTTMLGAIDEDPTVSDEATNCLTTPVFFQLMLQLRSKEQMDILIQQFGTEELSKHDEQGMTLLMYACLHGNQILCEEIIGKATSINHKVPSDAAENDCIQANIKGWTALSFAVVGGHSEIVKLLLENGTWPGINESIVEGDRILSPMHLAAAAGHLSILKQLVEKHQNNSSIKTSYINTSNADFEENIQMTHPCCLAAAHGHKRILRKLLNASHHLNDEQSALDNMLSLKEALTEDKDNTRRASVDLEKLKVLKEAMYESVEHGYIDVSLEIRGLDVPWSYHTWITTLMCACECQNEEIIRYMVMDFPEIPEDEIVKGFTEAHACLFFEILGKNLNAEFAVNIASIIGLLYSKVPRKDISYTEEEVEVNLPKIGTKYVNNKEMADIIFRIEGKPFFAHKIILQNASKKLQELTRCTNDHGEVNLDGIKYSVFEAAMQFLYSGGILYQSQPDKVLELLACAAKLQLVALKQSCEHESIRHITSYNAVDVYTCAKNYKAYRLEKHCYHFFLANLSLMMSRKDFKDLLDRNQTLCKCLETEFLQALFGEQQINNNVIIATYL